MTREERAAILDALVNLPRLAELAPDPLATFLPVAGQRRALRRDTLIVLGDRGAGKTALFRMVNDARTSARLRAFYEDESIPEARWIDAFSERGMKHPEVGAMEARAGQASDLGLRAFWMTHLLRRVQEELSDVPALSPVVEGLLGLPVADVGAWLPLAEQNLGAVSAALDTLERALVAKDQSVVATYDNLDRVAPYDLDVRRRYVGTLLALWLSLASRYKKLRGKIFLRDDLFNGGELGFADAGKLRARAETITWDPEALYRVVVRGLAVSLDPVRAWLRDVPGLVLRDRGEFGWVPGDMPDEVQRAFIGKLAWRVLGKGVIKNETHRWIVNRVWDAHQRVTPRAILWFFGFAGEAEQRRLFRGRKTPLVADDLVEAIHRTSRERVEEVKEEYPGAVRMENLRGMKLPLGREDVVERLSKPRPEERTGLPVSGEAILRELLRCGVLRAGEEGKLDVPDIYRYAFEITPDYATAWEDFLLEDKPAAKEMWVRELADLGRVLETHAAGKWGKVGADAIERKDLVAAREQCERALDLARSAGDVRGEADVLVQLGHIELADKQPQRARDAFRRALDLAKRAHDKLRQADSLWWVGVASFEVSDYEAATSALLESARMGRDAKDSSREAVALVMLSRVARQGDPTKTLEHLTPCLFLAQRDELLFIEALAFREFFYLTVSTGSPAHPGVLVALSELVATRAGYRDLAAEAAEFLAVSPDSSALREQAAAAYAKDRGWGVIREAFPTVTLPSL